MKNHRSFSLSFVALGVLGALIGLGSSSAKAFAALPLTSASSSSATTWRLPLPDVFRTGHEDYRLGDEWGKIPVTAAVLQKATPAFRRAALATAKLGGGTAFYLGKFNGFHVMATNHHVCPAAYACLSEHAEFPFLKLSLKVNKYFGHWSDIDLALFAVEVKTAEDEKTLAKVAGNFAFKKDLTPGLDLLTIGYGVADNPNRVLVSNQDHDCRVFSAKNDFHFMADPDDVNPSDYKAWSFANGCDVSHGDSGSAMIDRKSGEVLGIIWTGRIPKSSVVQSTAFLDHLLVSQGPEVWSQLSYAVPASKIGEYLTTVAAQATQAETKATLLSLLGH